MSNTTPPAQQGLKLCKDCKHASRFLPFTMFLAACNAPQNMTVNPVDGEPKHLYSWQCEELRDAQRYCGPDAEWFEPKK